VIAASRRSAAPAITLRTIAERIRDKIAASRRKGMWMGGNLPLGYDVRDLQHAFRRRRISDDAD
jgi:DNA invertase Pin-like site-specific DNA recombinase